MKFVPHPKETRNLGAPVGWDHSKVRCGSLSISDITPGGQPAMESLWVPEGFEGARLALGEAEIRLAIYGVSHPPVSMVCWPKMSLDRETKQRNLDALLGELREYALVEDLSMVAPA